MAKTKIAILGGGMGAMSTAWKLTENPADRQKYEITVYQKDWMLGGKCASSRNAADDLRIQEHGIHLLLGFYENAFRTIREAYTEANAIPGTHLPTFDQAILPWDTVWMAEQFPAAGNWVKPWRADFPVRGGEPGVTPNITDPLQLLQHAMAHLEDQLLGLTGGAQLPPLLSGAIGQILISIANDPSLGGFLKTLVVGAIDLLVHAAWAIAQPLLHVHQVRHAWIGVYLVATTVRGIVRDDILSNGPQVIDNLDFRVWLQNHQTQVFPPLVSWDSPPIRAFYDLAFSRDTGLAAGVTLRALSRMAFGYPAHFTYKMKGGMGEVVFSPLYLALKERGVSFRFMHEVTQIRHAQDQNQLVVQEIDLAFPTGADTYQNPLVTITQGDGTQVDAWPAEPPAQSNAPKTGATLVRGADFDIAVLAIPAPGLTPTMVGGLKAVSPAFHNAVEHSTHVGTQCAQVWMDKTGQQIGWPTAEHAMLISYERPFMAWVDMSHTLQKEDGTAKAVHYLCDEMKPADGNTPAQVRQNLEAWIVAHSPPIWPQFQWQDLHDKQNRVGPARLDAQYYRANVVGSERYVTVGPASMVHRIAPDQTGFRNLAVAGDWVDSELPAGCLEGATLGGLGAGNAILGSAVKT